MPKWVCGEGGSEQFDDKFEAQHACTARGGITHKLHRMNPNHEERASDLPPKAAETVLFSVLEAEVEALPVAAPVLTGPLAEARRVVSAMAGGERVLASANRIVLEARIDKLE